MLWPMLTHGAIAWIAARRSTSSSSVLGSNLTVRHCGDPPQQVGIPPTGKLLAA
jgi:hypothetical protein